MRVCVGYFGAHATWNAFILSFVRSQRKAYDGEIGGVRNCGQAQRLIEDVLASVVSPATCVICLPQRVYFARDLICETVRPWFGVRDGSMSELCDIFLVVRRGSQTM